MTLIWNPVFVGEHDSAWGLLQTLCWFNHLSPLDMIRQAGDACFPCPGTSTLTRSFVDTRWLELKVPAKPLDSSLNGTPMGFDALRLALAQRGGSALCGDLAPVLVDARVRYCRYCLESGFHALVHQLRGLARCPRHGIPLADHCMHCRAPMPPFALGIGSLGYACAHCQRSWLRHHPHPIAASEADRRDGTLGLIRRWANELTQLPYDWSSWSPAVMEAAQFPDASRPTHTTSMAQAALWLLHDIVPFPETPWLTPRPSGLYATVEEDCYSVITAPAQPGTLTRRQLARRVDAFIRRQWLGAHRACVAYAASFLPVSVPLGSVDVLPALCPLAQAYGLWRLRMGRTLIPAATLDAADRHPVNARHTNRLCGVWLSMFHYAVSCVRHSLGQRKALSRHIRLAHAADPYLRLTNEPWESDLVCLYPTRLARKHRPLLVYFRTDLHQAAAHCTLPHWPDGKPQLAHPESPRAVCPSGQWDSQSRRCVNPPIALGRMA